MKDMKGFSLNFFMSFMLHDLHVCFWDAYNLDS